VNVVNICCFKFYSIRWIIGASLYSNVIWKSDRRRGVRFMIEGNVE